MSHDFDAQPRSITTPEIGADEISSAAPVYRFTGTGNWNLEANWFGHLLPPIDPPAGSQIIVDPSSGSAVLNVPQKIVGGTIRVITGKNLVIQGSVTNQ